MRLYDIYSAAETLGCHHDTVSIAAQQHGIGTRLKCGWAFTSDDLTRLRAVIRPRPGNPNWVKKAPPPGAAAFPENSQNNSPDAIA